MHAKNGIDFSTWHVCRQSIGAELLLEQHLLTLEAQGMLAFGGPTRDASQTQKSPVDMCPRRKAELTAFVWFEL